MKERVPGQQSSRLTPKKNRSAAPRRIYYDAIRLKVNAGERTGTEGKQTARRFNGICTAELKTPAHRFFIRHSGTLSL